MNRARGSQDLVFCAATSQPVRIMGAAVSSPQLSRPSLQAACVGLGEGSLGRHTRGLKCAGSPSPPPPWLGTARKALTDSTWSFSSSVLAGVGG